MSDTTDFAQKISISAMSEQRLHILVLKHHLLDMRRANRSKYSTTNNDIGDIYKIVKDANKITDQGLYKLVEGSSNYDNPVPGPNNLPDLDYSFLYVIPFTDKYIRQYTLIADEGHSSIKTRLGTYSTVTNANNETSTILQWGPWRLYSDNNPAYELLSITKARVNENYLSFGNHELTLPDPKLCKVGDVIRLDQWKDSGIVTLRDKNDHDRIIKFINTYPVITGTCKKLKVIGLSDEPIIFEYESDTSWRSDDYRITIQMFNDVFYWVIINNGIVKYKSIESIFTRPSPTNATYNYFEEGTTALDLSFEVIQTSTDSKDIWSCNTYEFEIFNDQDIRNPAYNYWCVFISNTVKDPLLKLNQFYSKSFDKVYTNIESTNSRITETSRILTEYIKTVSAQISACITSVVIQHNLDIQDLSDSITSHHPVLPSTGGNTNT